MNANDVRTKYLDFFAARGHAIIPSASIVPENDPTTLFTGSGMQPMLTYFLGETHPKGTRITDSQKCFRAEDIDDIGDNRHTTFFEMLGNWSLGDYFKEEQIPWIFEFLVDEIGLDPKNLYVTVFSGEEKNNIPKDEETPMLWKKVFDEAGLDSKIVDMGSQADGASKGMQDGRIFYYDSKENWWSRAGVPDNMPVGEPGGPDSEMFYDFGTEHDTRFGEHCHPACDCGRFMEIGNSVFMQYVKKGEGVFEELEHKNIDFGGGLERIVAAAQNMPDVFLAVSSLADIIRHLENASGKKYEEDVRSFRIIADHIRGALFMIGDGVRPSNTEQGYFARRLIRRSVQYADALGIAEGTLVDAVSIVTKSYEEHYPELTEKETGIKELFAAEETKFRKTLTKGMREFEKLAETGTITGEQAFLLFTTYGFPIELTQELAEQKGIIVDRDAFTTFMKEHQAKSRSGAEQKFKGGLADHSEATTMLHTTHHILLRALQIVLGDHVKQRGSNITSERLRIDFSHDEKMTDEQKSEVERIVNEQIEAGVPVMKTILPKEEAERLGAQKEFGQKYPDMVNVYSVGPKDATEGDPKIEQAYSLEFCGGPHVTNTGNITGVFRIQKEQASSAGVRRIKGVLE
ncbi:alanine--tRNA ligase [Candidatus Kaiserbacteria bacterium]|nr:MAG: alanine--tRNA ligase [Candidatus Kaiserbacteria bacterium]